MNDETFLAAEVVKLVGAMGLGLLTIVNAGGLALAIAHGIAPGIATLFLAGLAAAFAAILLSYLLAQMVTAGATHIMRSSSIIPLQLAPALTSAVLFFWAAFLTIHN